MFLATTLDSVAAMASPLGSIQFSSGLLVAADPSSGVFEVVVVQYGAVRGRLRPGDVAF